MKYLLAVCLAVVYSCVWAAENPSGTTPKSAVVKGEVLEVKEIENFTYLRLKTKDGETWAAIINAHVKKGAQVTIENVTVMNNFESKSLKRVFPTILFGSLANAESATTAIGKYMAVAQPVQAGASNAVDAHIPKASGANAVTVEEIITKASALKGKPVLVRGKVVKYNPDIMGKNWIHLRDGSGTETKNTNDILVTTANQAKTGDVVTVKGIVGTDKDFGAGYSYKVLIEDATLQPH